MAYNAQGGHPAAAYGRRRSSSKLKTLPIDERMLLQLPRMGLATEDQLQFLETLFPGGGAPAIFAILNLMHSGVVDGVMWSRESWVGDSVGSVTGIDDDKLDLLEPVAMPPTGALNLLYTEGVLEQMMTQLRSGVEKVMNDSAAKSDPIEKMAAEVPRQVVLLVQRIRFTKAVQKCEGHPSNVRSSIESIKLKLGDILLKNKEIGPGYRATLMALQLLIHEQLGVLQILEECKSEPEFQASWRSQWKFFHDTREKLPFIEVKFDDKMIQIGYEYSPPRMLITTEFTHILRWAYTNAMCEGGRRLFVLIGPPGSGMTGMLSNIGQLLGTLPTIIRCNEEVPATDKWWRRRLTAAMVTGGGKLAPVIITQAHRVSNEVISMALQVANDLNESPPAAAPPNSGLSLCVTMAPGDGAQRLCSAENSGPLAGVAVINVPAPDLKVIAAGQLAAEGLKDSETLAGPLANILMLMSSQCSKQLHYDFGPRTLRQLCTQIGVDRNNKSIAEKEVVTTVIERCLTPKLVKDDVAVLENLLEEQFGKKTSVKVPSEADEGRWYKVAENIRTITKIEPDCMVLPVPDHDLGEFYGEFCKMLNRHASARVEFPGKLSDMTPEQLLGKMPKKGPDGTFAEKEDGELVKVLRQAMEEHPDPTQQVWITMETGDISPATWEGLHELLNDSKCLNLATGEQIRLNENLRFLFVMPSAGTTPQDTFSRSAVVYTDPAP